MLGQTSIAVMRLFAKRKTFSKKNKIFYFTSLLVGFDFAVSFVCFDGVFYSFAIMKR